MIQKKIMIFQTTLYQCIYNEQVWFVQFYNPCYFASSAVSNYLTLNRVSSKYVEL